MNIGMYQSAASLTAIERWQDTVSQNIASSQVTGYKKRTVDFSGISMGEINYGAGRDRGMQTGVLPKATVGVNFQPGETHTTGRSLDVALQGEGFFEVQRSSGERAFTRSGEFHVRPDRTLTTSDGSPVLSNTGSPITLLPQGGEVSIGPEGMVTQGDAQLGHLSVVKFLDPSRISPTGSGYFMAQSGAAPTPIEHPQILQGYLENSNVTPLREMVALIQIARAYESNQKLITSYDQTLSKALETLG